MASKYTITGNNYNKTPSSDFLDKVDEGLYNYADHQDMSFMEDDEITDYIDSQMNTSTHQFTRVDKQEHFPDLEIGDKVDFNSYYVSFSESMGASNQYLTEMNHTSHHIIFRTNGPVNDFDMYEYTPSEYTWQEEHLLQNYPDGEWVVDNISDVSNEYGYGEDVLLVDISIRK